MVLDRAEFPVFPWKKRRVVNVYTIYIHTVLKIISSTAVQVQEIHKGEKQLFWVCIPLRLQHTQLNKVLVLVQHPPQKKNFLLN